MTVQTMIKASDLKNRTYRFNKIQANCPECCPDGRGRAAFVKDWTDRTETEAPIAVWTCGGCNFQVKRIHRPTKRERLLSKSRKELAFLHPLD